MLVVGVMVLGAGVASAQNYPTKPIRIVTGGVGGVNDIVARLVAQGLNAAWGQPAVVDNRPSGLIPVEIVSKAQPDGYTLIVIGNSFWTQPLMRKVPYDPVRDFSPITVAIKSPTILTVHPSLPVKSVQELIDLAKAKPGVINYASTGVGGPQHIGAELFKAMAGINMVHVPYKGVAATLTALIAGEEVQVMFANALTAAPHLSSGRLRALAVTSTQASALAPGLPTVAVTVPGYELTAPQGIFAPAKTPQAIITRLNQEIVRILNKPESKQTFLNAGVEVVGSPPDELTVSMKSDMNKIGKLIKDGNIKVE